MRAITNRETVSGLGCEFSDGVKFETLRFDCSFTDPSLTKIAISIPRSIKAFSHGTYYNLRISLGEYIATFSESLMAANREVSSLRLFRLPQIDRIEPQNVLLHGDGDLTVFVTGRNFDGLDVNASVECTVTTRSGAMATF